MRKIFIDLGYRSFYNYDCMFIPELPVSQRCKLPNYCISATTKYELEDRIKLAQSQYVLKEESSIHLLNSIPIAIDDLRAHYDIRRKVDTADFNVFFYDSEKFARRVVRYDTILVFPEHQKALCRQEGDIDIELARMYFPQVTENECVRLQNISLFWPTDYNDVFPKILRGTLKKPCVPHTCLDFANPNELTMDVLQMTLMAARSKDEQAFLTQLAILNQTNWTKYPGTMYYLRKFFKIMPMVYGIYQHPSKYSKMVNNILKEEPYKEGPNDLPMIQRLFNYFLNLNEDVTFVDYAKLFSKTIHSNLYPEDLQRVYNCIVRIKPKEFENEQVYSQAE